MKYLLLISLLLGMGVRYSVETIVDERVSAMLLRADREYWRTVASSPEMACRLRGGEYKQTGIYTDFVEVKIDYQCRMIEEFEGLYDN